LILFYNVHYIYLLLILELLLLRTFLLLGCFTFVGYGLVGIFFFLLLMVCMGGFRISVLVRVSRFYGRDFGRSRFLL